MKFVLTLLAVLALSVSCSRNSDNPSGTESGTGTSPAREAGSATGSDR